MNLQNANSLLAKLSLIRAATAEFFDLQPSDFHAPGTREIVRVRQIGMYLAKELTMASGPEVASFFGMKHHTSVLHAHKRIAELSLKDEALARAILEIRHRLEEAVEDALIPPPEANALHERLHRIENLLEKQMLEKLPVDREGITHHFTITHLEGDEVKIFDAYLTANSYVDGRLGEFFITAGRDSNAHAMFDIWAISTSRLLQRGEPIEFLKKFVGIRQEVAGRTSNVEIPSCTSVVDYVARYLLQKFAPVEKKTEDLDVVDDPGVGRLVRP